MQITQGLQMIVVDELATFMNVGWPGPDWYLTEHTEHLWEQTFLTGLDKALYRPVAPGTAINLMDYEARVCWQGRGADPTRSQGYRLSELFLRWRRKRNEAVVVAYVPHERRKEIEAILENAGCLVLTN